MRATIHGVFLLVFSIIQATWLEYIEIFGVKPNLFLVYVILVCCFCGRAEGAAVGFAFGFVLDMLVGRFWGLNALFGTLLGFFIAHFCEKILRNHNILISLAFVLLGSIIYEILYYCVSFLWSGNPEIMLTLVRFIIPEGVYNLIVALPLYFMVRRFAKFLYADKGENIG